MQAADFLLTVGYLYLSYEIPQVVGPQTTDDPVELITSYGRLPIEEVEDKRPWSRRSGWRVYASL